MMLKNGFLFLFTCIALQWTNAQIDNQKHELYKNLKISSIQIDISTSRNGAKMSEPKTFGKYGMNENGYISAYNTVETKGKYVFLAYNDFGKISEESRYVNNRVVPVNKYIYNDKGKLNQIMQLHIQSNKFWMSDSLIYYPDGQLKMQNTDRWTTKGLVLSITDSFSSDHSKSWKKDLQIKTTVVSTYNLEGQPIMVSTYKEGEKLPEMNRQYEYNSIGQLTSESLFAKDNPVPVESKKYAYNEHGDVVKIDISGEGDGSYTLKYEYKYDDNGLMIKKTEKNDAYGIIKQYTYNYLNFEENPQKGE
jgi:hypothetical protein